MILSMRMFENFHSVQFEKSSSEQWAKKLTFMGQRERSELIRIPRWIFLAKWLPYLCLSSLWCRESS